MKNLKLKSNSKGITLIALVITIIVLIILAGISINMLLGDNGIVTRTIKAAEDYNQKAIEEKLQLLYLGELINDNASGSKSTQDATTILEEMVGERDITQEDVDKFNQLLEKYNEKIISMSSKEDISKIGEDEDYPLNGIYIQLSDITYEKTEQVEAIGTKEKPFSGIYNGNGKKINGLNVNITSEDSGMFGVNVGTIKNIIIEDCTIDSQYARVGIIVGSNSGIIENCIISSGEVKSSGNNEGSRLGGISGENDDDGIIRNCINHANITGEYKLVGGLCGYNLGGNIENCINYGTIEGPSQVGGIAGDSEGTNSEKTIHVKKCVNYGNVKGIANGNYTSGQIGGIVGCNFTYSIIEDCKNEGTIESDYRMQGGIAGYSRYTIESCINEGKVINTFKGTGENFNSVGGIVGYTDYTTIKNNYNLESVTAPADSSWYVGGIAGVLREGSMENCYNTKKIVGQTSIGGIVGKLTSKGSMNSCYNIGDVEAYSHAGGLSGVTAIDTKEITNSYNKGHITAKSNYAGGLIGIIRSSVENCYNTGNITLESTSSDRIGSLFGAIETTSVSVDKIVNCYYLDTSAEKAYGNEGSIEKVDGAISKTSEEMENLAEQLGSEYKNSTDGDKYPKLIWEE